MVSIKREILNEAQITSKKNATAYSERTGKSQAKLLPKR